METPIVDFVQQYAQSDISRLHMPGHKGISFLGCEKLDITEIDGADVLYSADGIIQKSEEHVSSLFGTAHTFYSTEGSSLAIRAMLALVTSKRKRTDERPVILAARNVHKAFIYGCALLDLDVEWLYPEEFTHLCSCKITAGSVREKLNSMAQKPVAVYLTSPDYLGYVQDISGIAEVCKTFDIPLLVDNAHGAYQKFLSESRHPIDLGATMCCDSAHKTLPVLTGGAYLHISKAAPAKYLEMARNILSVFASTSPSYLILQSLDLCNRYLSEGYSEKLAQCIKKVDALKCNLTSLGFSLEESEPLKLVLAAQKAGYTGNKLSDILRNFKVEVEFSDEDYLVMMFTPEVRDVDYERIREAFESISCKVSLSDQAANISCEIAHEAHSLQDASIVMSCKIHNIKSLTLKNAECCMSIRDAIFSPHKIVDVEQAEGLISGSPTVSCPPAVPIVISGEKITAEAIALFQYYGIEKIVCVI